MGSTLGDLPLGTVFQRTLRSSGARVATGTAALSSTTLAKNTIVLLGVKARRTSTPEPRHPPAATSCPAHLRPPVPCYSSMMPSPQTVMVQPAPRVRGHVRPPGDKSISHRYALLAALADGRSEIHGYSTGGDCALHAALSARPRRLDRGDPARRQRPDADASPAAGWAAFLPLAEVLDAGNSGSTMRMLAGILAAHPFQATMTGDDSLRRRPMRRVIVPLERMGARIGSDDGRPPLTIHGTRPTSADRLRARGAQRAGQERGAPGRPARERHDDGPRAAGHAGSYGAGAAGVRRASRDPRDVLYQ